MQASEALQKSGVVIRKSDGAVIVPTTPSREHVIRVLDGQEQHMPVGVLAGGDWEPLTVTPEHYYPTRRCGQNPQEIVRDIYTMLRSLKDGEAVTFHVKGNGMFQDFHCSAQHLHIGHSETAKAMAAAYLKSTTPQQPDLNDGSASKEADVLDKQDGIERLRVSLSQSDQTATDLGLLAQEHIATIANLSALVDERDDEIELLRGENTSLRAKLVELLWEHVAESGSYDVVYETWFSNARSRVVCDMKRLVELGEAVEVGERVGRVMTIKAKRPAAQTRTESEDDDDD